MHSLRQLQRNSFAGDHLVALGEDGALSWSQLLADVAANRVLIAAREGANWALFESDSYRFTVALLALLAENRRVYLPGDNHAGMVTALAAQQAALLGEFPSGLAILSSGTDSASQGLALAGEVVVFTSGSTGQPKPISKTLAQLDAELAALEQQWGQRLGAALVAGTVSHQHFYGLLFQVLWPLCSGRGFWRRPFVDPLSLARQMSSQARSAWIMSPAHLHRLDDAMPWPELGASLAAVFSSGGMLQREAALAVRDASSQSPIEVLGSSETGGIAWRQQGAGEERWQPLPGISTRVEPEGALAICSPFLPDKNWYVTADAARHYADGSFELGARMDRIVKIEGKRVSLPQVESALLAQPWVAEAVALPMQRRRQYVAAVLVLSAAGQAQLREQGTGRFKRSLRQQLVQQLPAAAVPRQWRLVTQLPRNAQGKLQLAQLRELFALADAGKTGTTDFPAADKLATNNHLPRVLHQSQADDCCELQLLLDHSCAYLQGHFPGAPVLPGVVQIMWADHFARALLGVQGAFQGMKQVKFRAIVQPQASLILRLEYCATTGSLRFGYHSATGEHSQGRLQFEPLP